MKKRVRITYNSPVILSFVIICLIVTVIGIITNDASTKLLFSVYRSSLTDPLLYIRLFTHVLGHSGIEHFVGTAMYLLLVGPLLEEKYGPKNLLKVFFITAFVTGVIHCLLFDDVVLCGSSGIVFACILLSSFTAFKDGELPLSFIFVAVLFIGQEIYSMIFIQDNISNLTHIIGGIVGSCAGFWINKKKN